MKERLWDVVGIEVREVVGCSWIMGSRVVGVVGGGRSLVVSRGGSLLAGGEG